MAGAPPKPPSSNPTSPGAVVAALSITLAILIFFGALRMKRATPLAMVQEQGPIGFPRGRLPGDQVDSIPVAKYATAKRRCLAGDIATAHLNPSMDDHNAMSQTKRVITPRANFKDTIQHYWNMIHGPGNTDTTQHPVRDVQQSCPTCTEDFIDDDDVRILPCRHLFHPRCIDPWLRRCAITCPLWQVFQLHSI
ncbi:hypothetical protein F5B19DRAFT_495029 [Rostrohypoxylon terebratum]|nr:hypothetical protein F5B19DRAFT_495029 [Rostrohypoxylon terebratum]